LCALSPLSLAAADPSTPAPEPTATSTPEAARPSPKKAPTPSPGSVLNIHHKMLDPAWGRVVQYRKYEVKAYSEKERETLHEFVLQDTDNVVRVATYHENAKGEGYWEVWVWDLP
jgi:hypothetical protein